MTIRNVVILGVCIILLVGLFAVSGESKAAQESRHCEESFTGNTQKIDCWLEIIKDEFHKEGIKSAFDVFTDIYRTYDVFANTGCHQHAHRVGDFSYYFDYLSHRDISKMDFPQSTTSCGYGFFHGFLEHLIQDNPDPSFVIETCEYLTANLKERMPAIDYTCYHGSGHGFTLAQADYLTKSSQWTPALFTGEALDKCESMSDSISKRSLDDCQ